MRDVPDQVSSVSEPSALAPRACFMFQSTGAYVVYQYYFRLPVVGSYRFHPRIDTPYIVYPLVWKFAKPLKSVTLYCFSVPPG